MSLRFMIIAFGAIASLVLFTGAYLVDYYAAQNIRPDKDYFMQMGLIGSGLLVMSLSYFIWYLLGDD